MWGQDGRPLLGRGAGGRSPGYRLKDPGWRLAWRRHHWTDFRLITFERPATGLSDPDAADRLASLKILALCVANPA
jgi:hypothetical protein